MVLVMGRRQLRVVVRPKKIRYGPGSSCALLSQTQRADFAAFVKILMTAQGQMMRASTISSGPKKRQQIIKDLPNRRSFYFIERIYAYWDCFLINIIYDGAISLS